MPIATLSPDIDPSLSPIPAEFLLDAEGCALFVDPGDDAGLHAGHAAAAARPRPIGSTQGIGDDDAR